MEVHDSSSYQLPNNPPHKTQQCTEQWKCKVTLLLCVLPLPLPLSPCVSCHLSMKECQALRQSDWHFLLFRFSACFKWVVGNVVPKRLSSSQAVCQASTPGESPASFYHVEEDL